MKRAYPKNNPAVPSRCLSVGVLQKLETRVSDMLGVIELLGESENELVYGSDICLQGDLTQERKIEKYRKVSKKDEEAEEEGYPAQPITKLQRVRKSKKTGIRRLESLDTTPSSTTNQDSPPSLYNRVPSISTTMIQPSDEEIESQSESYLLDHFPSPIGDETSKQIDSMILTSDKTNANMMTSRLLFNST